MLKCFLLGISVLVMSTVTVSAKPTPIDIAADADKVIYPECTEAPNAHVFRITSKRIEDNIIFRNKSSHSNFDIRVYAFEKGKKWVIAAQGHLKDVGDRDTSDDYEEQFNKAQFYAIVPLNTDVQFKYEMYEEHHDLNINILDN
ncbi:MAG: hypothetical protein K6E51_08405 [Treponema sp.]|nr:hypothetical protein [Treponema sp.]